MNTDLIAFIRARLDEDEREALAVLWAGSGNRLDWTLVASATIEIGTETIGTDDRNVASHIARHDPARVMAEVDAKRRLLDLHGPLTLRGGAGARCFDTTTACRSCEPPQFPEHAYPCATLRLLALPYADHPDYRPAWAPDVTA
ncbi:DUF6221 family protein [Kitasatospora sp. NPDC091276]|uniref:DUF6221 family protein n=1 Tax=unclassified Kitasatospora TaxID=2633591 RepID=UPI00341A080B